MPVEPPLSVSDASNERRHNPRWTTAGLESALGHVSDLSISGMRISRTGRPPLRENATFRLEVRHEESVFLLPAKLISVQPHAGDESSGMVDLGISFPNLSKAQSRAVKTMLDAHASIETGCEVVFRALLDADDEAEPAAGEPQPERKPEAAPEPKLEVKLEAEPEPEPEVHPAMATEASFSESPLGLGAQPAPFVERRRQPAPEPASPPAASQPVEPPAAAAPAFSVQNTEGLRTWSQLTEAAGEDFPESEEEERAQERLAAPVAPRGVIRNVSPSPLDVPPPPTHRNQSPTHRNQPPTGVEASPPDSARGMSISETDASDLAAFRAAAADAADMAAEASEATRKPANAPAAKPSAGPGLPGPAAGGDDAAEDAGSNKRKNGRLAAQDAHTALGEVLDISGSGMRIRSRGPKRVNIGDAFLLDLYVCGRAVRLPVEVMRIQKAGWRSHDYGLRFGVLPPEMRVQFGMLARMASKHVSIA